MAATRVTGLPRRQRRPAAVEVGEVDDLPPACREAVRIVAVVRHVGRLPDGVRIASHRHSAAVENAVESADLTQRVPEMLLVQPPPLPARYFIAQARAQLPDRGLERLLHRLGPRFV